MTGRARSQDRAREEENNNNGRAERRSNRASDRSGGGDGHGEAPAKTSRNVDLRTVISSARAQLQDLTGRPAEAVTSVERVERGWHLSVELVELERIPASTSILGAYDVWVDHDGNLLEYARTGRYHRNQAGEAES